MSNTCLTNIEHNITKDSRTEMVLSRLSVNSWHLPDTQKHFHNKRYLQANIISLTNTQNHIAHIYIESTRFAFEKHSRVLADNYVETSNRRLYINTILCTANSANLMPVRTAGEETFAVVDRSEVGCAAETHHLQNRTASVPQFIYSINFPITSLSISISVRKLGTRCSTYFSPPTTSSHPHSFCICASVVVI